MSKQIDLTGFITEDIEVVFGDKTYTLPLDPDVESYIELVNYIQLCLTPETNEYIKAAKKFIVGMVELNNESIDKKKLEKSLGINAIGDFMVKYIDILMEKGLLKKAVTPQKAETMSQ